MTADYSVVQRELDKGTPAELLCATCPWDRLCVTPPSMTRQDIDRQIAEAAAKDKAKDPLGEKMPVGALLSTIPDELCETAAGLSEGIGPADEAADAGVSFPTGAAPAPSPVDRATGDGVTPVNDRLYEELLRPVVDRFYATAKSLAHLPVHESNTRAYRLGRLDALEEAGDLIADAILVAFPEWEAMREMALASTTPGTAATPPAAVPDPHTPARVAVTTSDSGCPGGHHNVPGRAT